MQGAESFIILFNVLLQSDEGFKVGMHEFKAFLQITM